MRWIDVGPSDTVVELGCGDGRVALEAARRGATAVCVERDAELAAKARRLADGDPAGARVEVHTVDLFRFAGGVNMTNATVVFLFLLPEINARLRAALRRAPRLRTVLSHKFEIAGWPCGERLYAEKTLFLRWDAPLPSSIARDFAPDLDVAEHALECAADDAVRQHDEL